MFNRLANSPSMNAAIRLVPWRVIVQFALLVACQIPSAWADEQIYTAPQLFSGTLYLATTSDLSQDQSSLINAEIERTNNEGSLVGIGSKEQCEQSSIWKFLSARSWSDAAQTIGADAWNEETVARLKRLKRGSCVWIDQRTLAETSVEARGVHSQALRACLDRGVLVILQVHPNAAGQPVAAGWQLIPDIDLLAIEEKPLSDPAIALNQLRLQIAKDNLLRIGRRELISLSSKSSPNSYCDLPATSYYDQPITYSIGLQPANGQVRGADSQHPSVTPILDLTAARRALIERQRPIFPASDDYHPTLAHGSLVIVGGGGASPEIWEKFVELAGGKEARIVILPTAVAEPEYEDDDEARLIKRAGAQAVRILPQNARDEVSKPEYLENLRWATGIWFGGGRQWRFVDAYWGTPAWEEIKQVLARGGVIGGSSAGATIQGDLLVRGHPLGNQIMVADGYRRGLGLLPGVAIDQHFKQRNRFDDLAEVVKRFPKIYGIGIDESTALIVGPPNRCQVLGKGSVWLTLPSTTDRHYIEHPSGDEFELK